MNHSIQTKKKLSEKRIKFLKEHPEKHPWRSKDKFKSVPCEKIKSWLSSHNIQFIGEFEPMTDKDRFFSIDIAFPDKLIGIEINGNQHYNRDGTLKPYYQNRHSLLESIGWTIYELHYSVCFHLDKFEKLLPDILNGKIKQNFNYFTYQPRQKKQFSCVCGNKKTRYSKTCNTCRGLNARKVIKPSKDELEKLVWQIPSSIITIKLGLKSDTNISKWCKEYEISKPPRGYWAKKMAQEKGVEPS